MFYRKTTYFAINITLLIPYIASKATTYRATATLCLTATAPIPKTIAAILWTIAAAVITIVPAIITTIDIVVINV